MKVAYLGPQGSFSEEAAFRYFADQENEWHKCDSIVDVLEAVEEGIADKGIVPIENSIEGTINITADGLLRHDLFVEAEIIFPVSLHLLALKGAHLEEIREVWSIVPALAQCRDFIREAKVKSKHYDSTSAAAQAVNNQERKDVAAIASKYAAEVFDLEIIKSGIQDNSNNHTRFVVISKENKEIHPENTKTMLLISPTSDYSGVLSSILNVFTALSINLTWIESRPTKKQLGTYHFFVEAQNGFHEEKMNKAITILEAFGHDVRVLGSYRTTKL
ncbi:MULTISPECIES: prephenate dehydratase [Fictibacillus]|jgi:prephenate dehydratase|uniref:prephenate dehydratase n=1 Tax=Fictibacillus TaxID=1329200 RepID=UPI0018CF2A29|nr:MULTISPECIES: prephenate dehydratase [unclassified Fictibacillus]MBH0161516.1 prephenate dehydratase [Fictibacillus sp. 26RED30]MBH0172524.1 prephenate dehydratase [Fictibacillus sp. 23RED33]